MHTAASLTEALLQREEGLSSALGCYQEAITKARDAEICYEVAKASAGLLCEEKNEVRRKAWVLSRCIEEYTAWRIADGLENSAKAAYFVAQTRAQNGVSLLALHRTEMKLAMSPTIS